MAINGSSVNRVAINAEDTITLTPTLSATSTSTSTINKAISKIFTLISEMSLVVITESAFHLVLLSVTKTTVSSIKKAISLTFSAGSATIASLIAGLIPRLGAVSRYTFTANMRDTLIQLFKQRNVRANESNKKVLK